MRTYEEVMREACKYCHTGPCRCDSYLVSNDDLESWERSDGEYLNRRDVRRLIATVQSLRDKLKVTL